MNPAGRNTIAIASIAMIGFMPVTAAAQAFNDPSISIFDKVPGFTFDDMKTDQESSIDQSTFEFESLKTHPNETVSRWERRRGRRIISREVWTDPDGTGHGTIGIGRKF